MENVGKYLELTKYILELNEMNNYEDETTVKTNTTFIVRPK